ncbi:MAG: PAS domain-containing sensor histidine kinase, partial [Flavitalea sp.]
MPDPVDYKNIFNELPGVYLILLPDSPAFTIAELNESRIKVTLGARSSIGKPLFDVYTDNPQNPLASGVTNLRSSLETVIATKKPHIMDVQRYDIFNTETSNFDLKYWKPINIPVLDEENNIRYIIHVVEDITKTVLQEQQQVASEEKYRQLFDNSPAVIIIWTLDDLRIREVNQAAIDLYKYSAGEFSSLTILDIRPVEEHQNILNQAINFKKHQKVDSNSVWQELNKNGETIYMNVSFHKISYDGMDAILSMGTNVTEKLILEKKLDRERQKQQKKITEAVLIAQENERAELGRELHDNINQILITIRLYLDLALSRPAKDDELLHLSKDHIGKAIKELLRLSRALMPPSLGDITLKQSLEDLLLNFNSLKGINFKYEVTLNEEKFIPDSLKLTIFRILQEQLSNIL